MLSPAENEKITRVAPGTPCGELFRRYWIPAGLSEELPDADGPPVRVRLLGEDRVAFRDSSGAVGLVEDARTIFWTGCHAWMLHGVTSTCSSARIARQCAPANRRQNNENQEMGLVLGQTRFGCGYSITAVCSLHEFGRKATKKLGQYPLFSFTIR